jgi:hypothetical protein
MGSLCSSLFGSSQSTTYQPPEAVKNAVTDILNRAATQSNQPYPQYTPDTAAQYQNYNAGLVAPLTPNQAAAGQTIAGLQGYTAPNFQAATGLAAGSALPLQRQQFSQSAVNQYLNPYLNDVVNSAVANINQTNAQQQQQVLGNAIQRGAFGGDRAGIAQAELARQQNLANNATISNLLGQGYQSALGEFNAQQGVDLATQLQNRQLMSNAAVNLANLGTQGQQAQLQQAQAQYGYGTAEQQQQQAGLSTAYQQYLNQQAFPYQQLSYYAGLASGAAPALGGTTTGYTPTVSPVAGALGGLNFLGNLTNPATYGSGQALSGIGSLASGASSLFNALPAIFNQGGRVERAAGGRAGYADGGTQTVSPVTLAYNDYQNAVRSGAPLPILQQLYAKYQQSLQGATPPWATPSTGVVAAAAPKTPSTSTGAGGVSATAGPSGGPTGDYGGSNYSGGINAGGGAGPGAAGGPTDEYGYNPRAGDTPGFGTPGAGGGYGAKQQQGLLSGLLGGVDKTTGAQTGIAGAIDALFHGNSPGTLNAVLNAPNNVAYGTREDGSAYPNTTSGMTAQEFADKFTNGDVSKVKGSIVNGQIDWYSADNPLGDFFHPGGLPASQLSPTVGPVTSKADLPDENAVEASTAATSGSSTTGKTINPNDIGAAYGLPAGWLGGQLYQESGLNPDATSKTSSATGIGQFTKGTAAALGVDPTDVVSSVYGAATLAQQNADALQQKGVAVTPGTLSLAYQFGAAGAAAIAKNPNMSIFDALKTVQNEDAALKAVVNNGYNISDTSKSVSDNVGRNINASMRAASQTDLNIPTRTLESSSLDNQPENTQERANAAAAAAAGTGGNLNLGNNFSVTPSGDVVSSGPTVSFDTSGVSAVSEGHAPGQGISAAAPADTGGVSAVSEGHGPGAGISGGPTASSDTGGVSAVSEGHGPGEGISADRGMPDQGNINGSDDSGSAGGRDTGGEKRGGRIGHYASGGFTPITMQYGLPSEQDLQEAAQSLAGTGVGALPITAEALASKGVLPSKKGGRIHAQTGVGISSDNNSAPTDDQQNLNWWDPGYDPEQHPERMNRLIGNAQRQAEVNAMPRWQKGLAYLGKGIVDTATAVGQDVSSAYNWLTAPESSPDPSTGVGMPQRTTAKSTVPTGKPIPNQKGVAFQGTPEWAKSGYDPFEEGKKTQPIIPTNGRADRDQTGTGAPNKNTVDPSLFDYDLPNKQVAQGPSITANDGTKEVVSTAAPKEVAPGITQWYNAPPPTDLRPTFGLNYSLGVLSGQSLAAAGNDYAKNVMAQQQQERATMQNQAQSAQERAASGLTQAQAAQQKIYARGPFVNQLVTNPDGSISMTQIPGFDSGFGSSSGQGTAGVQQFTGQNYEATPLDLQLGPVGSVGDPIENVNKSAAIDKYINTDARRIMADVTGSQKQFQTDNTNAQAAALLASDTQNNLYQQAVAITKLPEHGPLKVGAASQQRIMAYNYLKTALPPGVLAEAGVENPDDLSTSEVANKIATRAAQLLGNDAAATWKTVLRAAQPGTDLQKASSNELITAALISQKRDKDRGVIMHEYGNRTGGYGPSGTQVMNEANPPALYQRDQEILRDILDNRNLKVPDPRNPGFMTTENPATLLMQKLWTPEQFNAFVDKHYAPKFGVKHLNLAAYLQ